MKKITLILFAFIALTFACTGEDDSSENTVDIPTVVTGSVSDITQTTASVEGDVTSDNGAEIVSRGICWSLTNTPTTSDSKTTDSGTTGAYISSLSGLTAGTTYFARAYATNSKGTGYGNVVTFTTSTIPAVLPSVITAAVSAIMQTTATSGGNVTAEGSAAVTARGVVWSLTQNPTIVNSKTIEAGTTGAFVSNITSLAPNTHYYLRAYASSSAGTSYGAQIEFTTLATSSGPVGANAVCNGTQPTMVVEVTSPTGKIWMDRNLGASRAGISKTDHLAYGCLYQWGRGNDGHASITWNASNDGTPVNASTMTVSSSNTPGNALFIRGDDTEFDWRSPKNNNLWQGVSGINNPCPAGFRLPTQPEVAAEFSASSITNSTKAFNSPMKLVVAGLRGFDGAYISEAGMWGFIWSSTPDGNFAIAPGFNQSAAYNDAYNSRANGFSVRCIKN